MSTIVAKGGFMRQKELFANAKEGSTMLQKGEFEVLVLRKSSCKRKKHLFLSEN